MANLKVTGCHFIVNVPIYNLSLLVMLGYGREKATETIKLNGGDPSQLSVHESYGGLAFQEGKTSRFCLYFPNHVPVSVADYGDLQHEIRHIVDFMMEHVCLPFHLDYSSEAYAYLTGYLTEAIYDIAWRVT